MPAWTFLSVPVGQHLVTPTAVVLQKIHGRWAFFTMSIGRVYMKIEAENYSAGEIAPIGHTSAQVPQSTHTFGSIL